MSPIASKDASEQGQRRPRVIFLTGAPDHDKLDWHHARLLAHFQGRLRNYLNPDNCENAEEPTSAFHVIPKWRTIQCSYDDAATSTANSTDPQRERGTEFLSFEDDTERSEFLDHTLASFQRSDEVDTDGRAEVRNSNPERDLSFSTLSSTDISFESASNSIIEFANATDIKFPDSIQDLKRLPSASHLLAIQPQTVTVHLLVGMITVETRIVQLRKRTGQMDLVELLVGDETAAPFKITFWLQHLDDVVNAKRASADPDIDSTRRAILNSIRPGDILLLTNVALDVFKNTTYGQSLTRRRAGCTTDVVNVSRIDVETTSKNIRIKFQCVRKWARDFVGVKDTGSDLPDKRGALPNWSPIETWRAKRQRYAHDDMSDDNLTNVRGLRASRAAAQRNSLLPSQA
jgi:hypothetical protein